MRKTISVKPEVNDLIIQFAEKMGVYQSGFIEIAIIEYINRVAKKTKEK